MEPSSRGNANHKKVDNVADLRHDFRTRAKKAASETTHCRRNFVCKTGRSRTYSESLSTGLVRHEGPCRRRMQSASGQGKRTRACHARQNPAKRLLLRYRKPTILRCSRIKTHSKRDNH